MSKKIPLEDRVDRKQEMVIRKKSFRKAKILRGVQITDRGVMGQGELER